MATFSYGQRLGSITDTQLQAALDRFGLGQLRGAAPVPFGLFGQNLFLTSTQGEYVLRGAPHYDWQLPAEQFFARLLHERTAAPVPWPYLLDPSSDLFGWSYAIMPRTPGLQLADPAVQAQLTTDDRHGIARALGANLAQMQRLRWSHAGLYDLSSATVEPLGMSYGGWVVGRIGELLLSAQTHSTRTTAADLAWVEQVLEHAQPALDEPLEPCFVMEDYKEGNTVVERASDGWRVSGVFDLMTAHMGDGEADLSRQTAIYLDEDPALAASFLRGYIEQTRLRLGFAERFPLYMLYDRVIIWEYLARAEPGWQRQPQTLREWAGPYMDALGRLGL